MGFYFLNVQTLLSPHPCFIPISAFSPRIRDPCFIATLDKEICLWFKRFVYGLMKHSATELCGKTAIFSSNFAVEQSYLEGAALTFHFQSNRIENFW